MTQSPSTPGLVLWGRTNSINVRKVLLTLHWLGLPFERIDAGLQFGKVNEPTYRAMNPNGLVPVLQDGDLTLWESNVIVRYLCQEHGKWQLVPRQTRERYLAEQWMDWQQTTLNKAGSSGFVQWMSTPEDRRDMEVIEASVKATEPLFTLLDQHLVQRTWMVGDAPSMADIPVALEVQRWWALPQARPAWPHLTAWYERCRAQPGSAAVLDLPVS